MSPMSPCAGNFGVFNTEKEQLPCVGGIASCLIYALAQLNYLQSLALEKVNVNVFELCLQSSSSLSCQSLRFCCHPSCVGCRHWGLHCFGAGGTHLATESLITLIKHYPNYLA